MRITQGFDKSVINAYHMRRILFITIFVSCFSLSYGSEKDLYQNLCEFFITEKLINPQDTIGINYQDLICIHELINPAEKLNLCVEFGVFRFNYSGIMDASDYFLIKYKDDWLIFMNKNNPILVINELLSIRDEDSDLLSVEQCLVYIDKITKVSLENRETLFIPRSKSIFYIK